MALANNYDNLSAGAQSAIGKRTQLFINGEFRNPLSGQYYPIVDPSNGLELAEIAQADKHDVDFAVSSARKAFEDSAWSKMKPYQREALMLRLADLLTENAQELAELETLSSGRLIRNTRAFDVDFSVYTLRYMAGWSTKISGKTFDLSVPYLPDQQFSGFTKRAPLGVVAAITPWNVPLCQAIWKLAPVLATGCTIVLKPAEQTPFTALRLAQLCNEAGIPPGVVNVVTGLGHEAGAALVEHPGVNKISFTGSTETGKRIAAVAAPLLKKYTLELGGKSPVVIAEDADLNIAIPGAAWAIFGNHGQNCCAGSRLFVHERHYAEVLAGVAEIARSIKVGPGLDLSSQMGPLVHNAHRDKVLGMIKQGLESGAEVLCGGEAISGPGAYIQPTVLTGAGHDDQIVQREIFGPVLTAFSYKDDLEVIQRANATSFGLGASIWTKDVDRINTFFSRMKVGTVWINNHNVLDLSMPFGGVKDSGFGHELGEEGLLDHTILKAGVMRTF
ncbi:MAG TPA: aldehyde dehydrogenase family protein [Pseudomonas sp.]|nr:aldehyde dehydrogenase family protein [Pseudomonas sp.]